MAKTRATMPSSVATASTANDSLNTSPAGDHPTRQEAREADSPATSTTSPSRSSPDEANGYDKAPAVVVKRKRSDSLDDDDEEHQANAMRSAKHYDYSPPPRRGESAQHTANPPLNAMSTTAPRRNYFSPSSEDAPAYYNRDRQQPMAPPRPDEPSQGRPAYASPPPPPVGPGHHAEGSGSPSSHTNGQSGKRKRNFSNRTKTGCITCRQRKKKCDEARPICNNCHRGGFQCQGYTVVRGNWTKSNGVKGPVPLQSKDGHQVNPDNDAGGPGPAQHHALHASASGDPMVDASQGQYAAGPESRSRPSYNGQAWSQPGHPPPYGNDHLPPLAELTRSDNPNSEYPPVPQHPPPPPAPRDMPGRAAGQSMPPAGPSAPNTQPSHWQSQSDFRPTYPPPPRPESHHQPPMRLASTSHYEYQKSGAKTFTVEEVERSRMLRHTRFNYFDPTLKNERQRCAEALARYNNACMLRSGVSEQEARNMLMKVFDPSLDSTHHLIAPCKEKGVLAPGVRIEGPFKCTYGYNLRIMDCTYIGENTRIDDSARVDIGARTWIGPNVTILTTDICKDLVERKGAESTWQAAPVSIHSEVIIGPNAVIYPGVTLSQGSTVEPFAVVRDSLGENQIQRAAVGPRATS